MDGSEIKGYSLAYRNRKFLKSCRFCMGSMFGIDKCIVWITGGNVPARKVPANCGITVS